MALQCSAHAAPPRPMVCPSELSSPGLTGPQKLTTTPVAQTSGSKTHKRECASMLHRHPRLSVSQPETHVFCSQSRPRSWISVSAASTATHAVTQAKCLDAIPRPPRPLRPNLAYVLGPKTLPCVSLPSPTRKAQPGPSHQHHHQDSCKRLLNTAHLPQRISHNHQHGL